MISIEFFKYTFLNTIDKSIAMLSPLLIYFLFPLEFYNYFEYIFSISIILTQFIGIGSEKYQFYSYSNSKNKDAHTSKLLYIYKTFFLILSSLLILITFIIYTTFKLDSFLFILFIFSRSLFLYSVRYFSNLFRLLDFPEKIFYYSIPFNILALFSIIIPYYFFNIELISLYFIFLYLFCVYFYFSNSLKHEITNIFDYFNNAIKFSWPLLINAIILLFITNFGKIFAFNYLSADEMTLLSITQRICIIITFIHIAFMGYYSKRIFIDSKFKIKKNIILNYSLLIATFSIITFLIFIILKYVNLIKIEIFFNDYIKLALLSILFQIGFSIQSFLEIYFNRTNTNKNILTSNLICLILYLTLFNFLSLSLLNIMIIMNVSVYSGLLYLIFRLYNLKFKIL